MQFNSFSYILLFLPLTAAAYHLANRWKLCAGKLVLILAGTVFYALGGWKSSVVLATSLAVNFVFAKTMEKTEAPKQVLLAVPVVLNAALLFGFKYTGFVLSNLNALGASLALPEVVLPLGISFFTFQQIAYLVAVYKKELPRADALDYLVYILFFPKLIMGPLMDPVDFITQLNDTSLRRPSAENIAAGVKLFSFGLFKKLLLAVFRLSELEFLSNFRLFRGLSSLPGLWTALFLAASFGFSLTARNNYKAILKSVSILTAKARGFPAQ